MTSIHLPVFVIRFFFSAAPPGKYSYIYTFHTIFSLVLKESFLKQVTFTFEGMVGPTLLPQYYE